MTVGQEPCRIGKIVIFLSNLNRHFHIGLSKQVLSLSTRISDVRVDTNDKEIKTEANQKHHA
jgi:hypothetical protein